MNILIIEKSNLFLFGYARTIWPSLDGGSFGSSLWTSQRIKKSIYAYKNAI